MSTEAGQEETIEYDDLRLRFTRADDGMFGVLAEGRTGEGRGTFALPLDERDIELLALSMATRARTGRRRLASRDVDKARTAGEALFEALFQGAIAEKLRECLRESERDDRGLRISLSLSDAPELLNIPWELLYDPRRDFLSMSRRTPIIRYLDVPHAPRPLEVSPPLRILGMISNPVLPDSDPLDTEREREKLQRALQDVVREGLVEIEWLERPTLGALQSALLRNTFHVLHFIGHGAYLDHLDDGALLLESEHGQPVEVSGAALGRILCDHRSIRLAVLNACEGARSSTKDPLAGVAAGLVRRELPAVIAMQFEITDDAAISFAQWFYTAMMHGLPIDAAMAEARKGIYGTGNDLEWATPVLFMRVSDGRIFDVRARVPSVAVPRVPEPEPPPKPEPPPAQEAVTDQLQTLIYNYVAGDRTAPASTSPKSGRAEPVSLDQLRAGQGITVRSATMPAWRRLKQQIEQDEGAYFIAHFKQNYDMRAGLILATDRRLLLVYNWVGGIRSLPYRELTSIAATSSDRLKLVTTRQSIEIGLEDQPPSALLEATRLLGWDASR